MAYAKLTSEIISSLQKICGSDFVFTEKAALEHFAHDETEHLYFYPEVGVKPKTTEEISAILKLCHANRIPVTPRGGGTGLSGGALPIHGGVSLSIERMNKILEIDQKNLMAVVEPGVVTEVFQNEVEKVGLYYPPDPSSRGSSLLGGNIAENAGGPHALKYGVTKDYVLGLEAVLPSGEIIHTSGKLLKDVTGYNLTQILVGSEGTLAVVTKIILKLITLPKYRRLLFAPFPEMKMAAEALQEIFTQRLNPSACEFMEADAMDIVEKRLEKKFPSRGNAKACLLVELDGNDLGFVEREAEKAGEILANKGALDVIVADSAEKQQEIWRLRRSIGEAVKRLIYKEEDVVVPRANLPELVESVKNIGSKLGIGSVLYGHAGDGNVHVNLLRNEMSDADWKEKMPKAVEQIFEKAIALGGQITGEHGVGLVQKNYLPMGIKSVEMDLMKQIKKVFDPLGILNPGKIFPD